MGYTTEADVRRILDEFARAPAGAPGLRVLGSGPDQASPGTGDAGQDILAARIFLPRETPVRIEFADAQTVLAGRIFGSR